MLWFHLLDVALDKLERTRTNPALLVATRHYLSFFSVMSTQTTILCGVNCACAPSNNTTASCDARESCTYAKEGKCGCGDGGCKASLAKRGCKRGMNGECSCPAGTCQAAESARTNCDQCKSGACDCAPGQCKAAGFTA
ncbi:hypothetical protein JCM10296v2_005374 [Rhodotorula toruloides]